MTTFTLAVAVTALIASIIAILSSVGAYLLAEDVARRIDELWGDIIDDELQELIGDDDE